MSTSGDIIAALKVYDDEVARCIAGRCYWALLHLTVVLPDVCAALQAPDGATTRTRYIEWVRRYLADDLMSGEDWYSVRCSLLHQGRTFGGGRYSRYSFGQPSQQGNIVHKYAVGSGLIQLDVGEMSKEVRVAVSAWAADLEARPSSPEGLAVAKYLGTLAGERVGAIPGIGGLAFTLTVSQTTS
jgi:hypothetical protein